MSRTAASASEGGSTLAAVRMWANGFRSLPTPIRPSAQAWSGAVPRPEKGSRTTSPGRDQRATNAWARAAGKLARYEHIGWNEWPHRRGWSFQSGSRASRGRIGDEGQIELRRGVIEDGGHARASSLEWRGSRAARVAERSTRAGLVARPRIGDTRPGRPALRWGPDRRLWMFGLLVASIAIWLLLAIFGAVKFGADPIVTNTVAVVAGLVAGFVVPWWQRRRAAQEKRERERNEIRREIVAAEQEKEPHRD